jgi:hypothetical protein
MRQDSGKAPSLPENGNKTEELITVKRRCFYICLPGIP